MNRSILLFQLRGAKVPESEFTTLPNGLKLVTHTIFLTTVSERSSLDVSRHYQLQISVALMWINSSIINDFSKS